MAASYYQPIKGEHNLKLTMNGRPSEIARVLNSLGDDNHVNVTIDDAYLAAPLQVHRKPHHKTHHRTPKLASARGSNPKVVAGAKGYWAAMTPQQRRDEMSRRRNAGLGKKTQGD